MTDHGRAYVVARLIQCPDLATLASVWAGLGVEPQNDPAIQALKEQLKEGFREA